MQELDETKDGKVILRTVVDIEPILVANRAEFNAQPISGRLSQTASKGGLRKVASIPIHVLMSLGERGVMMLNGDETELRKFLNSHPEYRTARGRL